MASPPPSPSRRKSPAKPAASGPGRPKDLGKRAAILEAAKQLFAREGFKGVSMDQIAAAAGVSKLTVYSHFGDKESLFSAAITDKCQEVLPDDLFVRPPEGPLDEQLRAIGHAFFRLITSDKAISMHRMMNTPGTTENTLRELFWEAGPQRTHDAFAALLQALVAKGELDVPDVAIASVQFFTLIKGEVHARMTCGLCSQPGPLDRRRHIDATVDMFLRAYGRR